MKPIINLANLQEKMLVMGLNGIDLQRKTGLARDTVYRLVNHGGYARINTVKRVADVLEVPVTDIASVK